MKYFLRIGIASLFLLLVLLVPVLGNRWSVSRGNKIPNDLPSIARNFPDSLGSVKGETFTNSDQTQTYRVYGKSGYISARRFSSEREAYGSLIANPGLLSQGRVRLGRVTEGEGFFRTSDTRRLGFFWVDGPWLFTIEAQNRRALVDLVHSFPLLRLKFNPFRSLTMALIGVGSWILPLAVVLLVLLFGYILFTGVAGLVARSGSRRGDSVPPLSESELSSRIEGLSQKGQFGIREGGRFDYRVDKIPPTDPHLPEGQTCLTRSGLLTLNPLSKTVHYREFSVGIRSHKGEFRYSRKLSLIPVIPHGLNTVDEAGASLASFLQPVVTSAGWRWCPETEIPTTNALLRKMSSSENT